MSDFIVDSEVEDIARRLVLRFPDILSHVDVDRILCVREISRSQKNQLGACRPVKPPFNLLNPNIIYIIVIYYKAKWDDLLIGQKQLLVLHQLLHIHPEFDGSTVPHDASDWSFILDTFGSNYMERNDVPNLLSNREQEDSGGQA
jgi:predicted metallopeptidase